MERYFLFIMNVARITRFLKSDSKLAHSMCSDAYANIPGNLRDNRSPQGNTDFIIQNTMVTDLIFPTACPTGCL